jgi:hypothetical protein
MRVGNVPMQFAPRLAIRLAIVTLAVLLLFWIDARISRPGIGVALNGNLSDVRKAALDILVDYSKTLTSWSIALIGIIGYGVKQNIESQVKLAASHKIYCAVGVVSSVCSIFFGQTLLSSIVIELSRDTFDTRGSNIVFPSMLQFGFLLLSFICVSMYVFDLIFTDPPASGRPPADPP